MQRKKEKESAKDQSGHFMGFRVVSMRQEYAFSKILFRCKKRLTRKSEYINIESILSHPEKPANLFDYEEPLGKTLTVKEEINILIGVLDDQEVHAFLKSEDIEKAESVAEESLI